MATVIVPGMLRDATGGRSRIFVEGATLKAVVRRLAEMYPRAAERLLDETGELRHSVAIFVDGVEVKAADGLLFPVGPESEIVIAPAMSGGR